MKHRADAPWYLWALLVIAVFAAYQPAWHGGVLWDDDDHLTRPELQGVDGLYRIWVDVGATLQHYPVLHSAFWIENRLWGHGMTGYHLVNIGVHCLAAFLLACLLRRLAVPGAFFAAAIFALHPVQVESVAWITELKNTLSTVFAFSAALIYLRFDRTRRARDYILVALLFTLAVLTKTVAGTLPVALLIAIWWLRGRVDLRRDLLPLLPLLVFGVGAGLVTAWWEREFNRTTLAAFDLTWVERVLIAGRAMVFHASKIVWPVNLTFSYPRWDIDSGQWWQYLFPLSVAGALGAAWMLRGRSRGPLAALLFFCVSLGPTSGVFALYTFRYSFVADHYQYVACIGLIVLIVNALLWLADRWAVPALGRRAGAVTALACLAALTWVQGHDYVNAETLYRNTLMRNPFSWLAHVNLGNELQRQGQIDEAVSHYRSALAIDPDAPEAHQNLGTALQKLGRYDESIAETRAALRQRTDVAEFHFQLGVGLANTGRIDEAVTEFREALRLKTDYADAHLNLGAALDALGRHADAAGEFRDAMRLGAQTADTHYRLGNALSQLGRVEEAVAEYQQAIALTPGVAEYYANLGAMLQRSGRLEDALTHYLRALQIRPDSALIENNVGAVLIRLGRFSEALPHVQRAIQLDPGYQPARDNLKLIGKGK